MMQSQRSPRNISWEKKRGDTMAKSPHTGGERGIVPDWRAIGITRRIQVQDLASEMGYFCILSASLVLW